MATAESQCNVLEFPAEFTSDELARRAGSGCARSFSLLADRHRPRLLQVVLGRIGRTHEADAEDIVQEALARAWQKIDSYNDAYRFSTWLFTIALRISVDHLRRRKRLAVVEVTAPREAAGPPADHVMEQRDEVSNLWAVAERELTELQFTAMWLRYGEDLAVAEVAGALGKTRVGTRVLLHRARAALLRLLQSEDGGATADGNDAETTGGAT